jgi:hypothetical protein
MTDSETGRWMVTRYDVSIRWGGLEEGGWTYDWWTRPKLVGVHDSKADALAQANALNAAEQAGRSPKSWPARIYRTERRFGESRSRRVPRYE